MRTSGNIAPVHPIEQRIQDQFDAAGVEEAEEAVEFFNETEETPELMY